MSKNNDSVKENTKSACKDVKNTNIEDLNKILSEIEQRKEQLMEEQNSYLSQDLMKDTELYEKLNLNIQSLEVIENESYKIELSIYQKIVEELKENKMNELKDFFKQQSKYYNQKSEKYEEETTQNIEKYKEEIEKLIKAYDNLYINVFKIMKTASSNQKIAIANILSIAKKSSEEETITDIEKQTAQNIISTYMKKRENYSTIVKECECKIKWCIENVQKDVNEIFIDNMNQMTVYKENIFSRIIKMIFNKISGKNKFKEFLQNYETNYLNDIKIKNDSKISDVLATLKDIVKQMEETRKTVCGNI